jgi:hypothetical protein
MSTVTVWFQGMSNIQIEGLVASPEEVTKMFNNAIQDPKVNSLVLSARNKSFVVQKQHVLFIEVK